MNRAIIGVGSNIDPVNNIILARTKVEKLVTILDETDFIETAPLGLTAQPNFINGAWLIETDIEASSLEPLLKDIEDQLGRTREGDRNGPRTIDLDIVVWNEQIVDNDVHHRHFLKQSVNELMPGLVKG
jgi:2-amino-4-hydroxy-6-hydroxymethyldihydropteridine diphosphokinase